MTKGLENGWQVGEASSDFDVRRAFAHGEYMGALREQERIIKLLEKLIPNKPTYQMPMEYWVKRKLIEQAIALIKGENND